MRFFAYSIISSFLLTGFAQAELPPSGGTRELFLKVVASVGNHVISSREVQASAIIDKAMYEKGAVNPLGRIQSDEFREALNHLLIERMVYEEAKVFNVAGVSETEVSQMLQQVKQKTSNGEIHNQWKELSLTDNELKDTVVRKLRANKFIKYKSNSSYVQVSDEEAREYFNKNRLKFGTMEFEKFRENIKTFLAKSNAQNRIRDWFEILRKKHNVKNLITESRDAGP